MLNELRSSDGARRQQQRFCGPTVALTFNFIVSVGIILINKLVLGKVGFNFPISLTVIHYIVSWFFLVILKAFSALPASPSSRPIRFSTLLALGIVMSLSTGFGNVSLKYNSVGFYQMAKLAVVPSIVLAEFVSYGKRVSYSKVFAFTVVSIGVAVAMVTDLQFHFFGACVALAWIIPSATNKILWSNLQQQENWTALALMWKTTPIALFFLVALMPLLDPPGVLSFNWSFSNTMAILMSAVLGFLIQWSGALALGATSAITYVILGQFKTCAILLGGFLAFGSNPGTISVFGAVTALAGMSFYAYLTVLTSQQQPLRKISFRQAPFTLPKSKLSKEKGNINCGDESV